jgi:hypothetical protein
MSSGLTESRLAVARYILAGRQGLMTKAVVFVICSQLADGTSE